MEDSRITATQDTEHNDSVRALEQHLKQGAQIDLGVTHALMGGMYARTILIPAGTVLTGATHRKDHINIVNGEIVVTTDDGPLHLAGYHVLPTKAGKKRAGVAIKDTYWTTICPTGLTDLDAIEDELVEESSQLQTRVNALPSTPFKELEQ